MKSKIDIRRASNKKEQYPKIYGYGKGWKIFFWIFTPLLVALFLFVGYFAIEEFQKSIFGGVFLLIISLGMISLMILGMLSIFKSKFIVYADKFVQVGIFKTKELKFSEIKGYHSVQIDAKYTSYPNYIILPKEEAKKKIELPSYIKDYRDIVNLLENKFKNLDIIQENKVKEEIFSNPKFGKNEEERKASYKKFSKIVKYFNYIAYAVVLWVFIYPYPYEFAIITALLLPLIAIFLVYYSKGLVIFDGPKNDLHPSVAVSFILPAIVVAFRAFTDFRLIDYGKLLYFIPIPAIILLFVVGRLYSYPNRKLVTKIVNIILLSLFISAYMFGAIVMANCLLDNSIPKTYQVSVIDKHISHSSKGGNTYYLNLNSWGPICDQKEVPVPSSFYNNINNNEFIATNLKSGFLGIRWYFVSYY